MLKDFKYSFLFLGKFLGFYVCANLLYGIYTDSYKNIPDPITYKVTHQTSWFQNHVGIESSIQDNPGKKSIAMRDQTHIVINVFEGCNGLNVMIVFIAFMIAFGGPWKKMLWFLPMGLLIIHISNLLRIALLFIAAQHNSHYFYYIHKYFFTGILYVVVILLWWVWVTKFNKQIAPVEKQG